VRHLQPEMNGPMQQVMCHVEGCRRCPVFWTPMHLSLTPNDQMKPYTWHTQVRHHNSFWDVYLFLQWRISKCKWFKCIHCLLPLTSCYELVTRQDILSYSVRGYHRKTLLSLTLCIPNNLQMLFHVSLSHCVSHRPLFMKMQQFYVYFSLKPA